ISSSIPGVQDIDNVVITHPLGGTCFGREISRLRQYQTATALKVMIGEMSVVPRVAKPFGSSLLESYWPEAEHLSNGLGSAVSFKIPMFGYVADLNELFTLARGWVIAFTIAAQNGHCWHEQKECQANGPPNPLTLKSSK